jgi:tRNA-Thr(GGU) m(6)t(6)A37 methyltransferase TsaA
MEFGPIGVVHSPYREIEEVPCCVMDRLSEVAVVEIFRDFKDGIEDLEGFSHVMLIVHLHKSPGPKLVVIPRVDTQERGVFATRSPHRPNPIGVSIVELVKIEGRNLVVRGIDLVDGTPLLDLKPYVPYDARSPLKVGWLEGKIPNNDLPPEL